MMNKPQQAKLIREVDISAFGPSIIKVEDINNDGQYELLLMQTAGQLRSKLYNRPDIDSVDQELYCLTAIDLQGNVLWQDGKPYDRDMPFTSHGGSRMILVDDFDGDGRTEVAVIRGTQLAILDGATGETKNSIDLPGDNFVCLYSAQLGDPAQGKQILCKVNDRATPPWQYSNPTMVFNADLSIYHEAFAVRGAGHNIVAIDINGDGRDELLIGYSLLDYNCNEIWKLDFGPDFDYVTDHADQIQVSDLNNDGKLEIQYAGSEDFVVADFDGNILWTTHAGHSQTSISGNWRPDGEKMIIMCEKNNGLWGLGTDGEILWNRKELNGYAVSGVKWSRQSPQPSWPLFKPALKPFKTTPFTSDPAQSRSLWPCFLDGDGNRIDVFPWKDEYRKPARKIRAERSYDCGEIYVPIAIDIDNDGLDEVLIIDRYRMCIFHSPES